MYQVKSPILFLAFNRLDTTIPVFEKIASVQPHRLYIACDGAREKKGEAEAVEKVRNWLLHRIDWPCDVQTLFREENLGCRNAVSSAINWFFEHEERGIILEDDCLPETSFFKFCDELLEKYDTYPDVMSIGGTNYLDNHPGYPESYHFSNYFHCWGWATWRRAWSKYDVTLSRWPAFKNDHGLSGLPQSNFVFNLYWKRTLDKVYNGRINTWDYQMAFTVWAEGGVCIAPAVNMIRNIGFSESATHTIDKDHKHANRKSAEMPFPLQHPNTTKPNVILDKKENTLCFEMSLVTEMKELLRHRLSKVKRNVMNRFAK